MEEMFIKLLKMKNGGKIFFYQAWGMRDGQVPALLADVKKIHQKKLSSEKGAREN